MILINGMTQYWKKSGCRTERKFYEEDYIMYKHETITKGV